MDFTTATRDKEYNSLLLHAYDKDHIMVLFTILPGCEDPDKRQNDCGFAAGSNLRKVFLPVKDI